MGQATIVNEALECTEIGEWDRAWNLLRRVGNAILMTSESSHFDNNVL
jgi:hypothetical protein